MNYHVIMDNCLDFDSRAELEKRAKEIYESNGNEVGIPTRLNVYFGARLIYQEKSWVRSVAKRLLAKSVPAEASITPTSRGSPHA